MYVRLVTAAKDASGPTNRSVKSSEWRSPEAVWGKFARDSPLEGDGFELVVPRCVVGGRLADAIAEAPRRSGGLRRSGGMTKARCRAILGALPI